MLRSVSCLCEITGHGCNRWDDRQLEQLLVSWKYKLSLCLCYGVHDSKMKMSSVKWTEVWVSQLVCRFKWPWIPNCSDALTAFGLKFTLPTASRLHLITSDKLYKSNLEFVLVFFLLVKGLCTPRCVLSCAKLGHSWRKKNPIAIFVQLLHCKEGSTFFNLLRVWIFSSHLRR